MLRIKSIRVIRIHSRFGIILSKVQKLMMTRTVTINHTMKILILINDAPYGTEKAYNALRLANQLGKDHPAVEVRIFLMADAANCAIANQTTPNGYYNIERMLKLAITKKAKVKIGGSCAETRGLKKHNL